MALPNTDNFLTNFQCLCEDTEIPPVYAAWSAVGAISCALARRIWIDVGPYILYPNMYITLVGASGSGKSTAINLAESLLRRVEPPPNIVAQKLSPEALIDALRIQETVNCKQLLREKNEGFVISDELSTFLNRTSYEAGLASLLINFFDCKENFEYRTKGGGSQTIRHSCLGILSGSTPDWLMGAIPDSAVGGGLASRFCFIFSDQTQPPVPFQEFGAEKKTLIEKLGKKLARLSMLQGRFKFTEEAREYWKEKYIEFSQGKKLELTSDRLTAGYGARRFTHLAKLAMILAASEREGHEIWQSDLAVAHEMLGDVEKNLPLMITLITSSEHGQALQTVLAKIARVSEGISRKDLMRQTCNRLSSRDLDSVLETLVNSGLVTYDSSPKGLMYRLLS